MKHQSLVYRVLTILSDGDFHSGEALGQQFEVTRAAIWKAVNQLKSLGLEISIAKGSGYRIPNGIELLSATSIAQSLTGSGAQYSPDITVLPTCESTNSWLLEKQSAPSGALCIAEYQSGGKGRRGRKWVSPLGANLNLSMKWTFEHGTSHLSGLSLGVGIAVVNALEKCEFKGIGLKWPNDIMFQFKKLGGILVEITGDAEGPCDVIIGIGLTFRATEILLQEVEQPWYALELLSKVPPSRNKVAGAIISELYELLPVFAQNGLTSYVNRWHELDIYLNRMITASFPHGAASGISQGIDAKGGLIIKQDGDIKTLYGGDISVRCENHNELALDGH